MNPALPRAVATSAQAWKIMEKDVALRRSLMTGGFNEQRQKGLLGLEYEARRKNNAGFYLPARVEFELRDTNERAQALYDACCAVWEIRGLKKNRAFYRAVFENCLDLLFGTRQSTVAAELRMRDRRTNMAGNSDAAIGSLYLRMAQLRADWDTKLEIETRDNESRDQSAVQREAAQALAIALDISADQGNKPLRKRAPRERAPCYAEAAKILRKIPNLTLTEFCKVIDDKAARRPTESKYKPPNPWKVERFFDQYHKRANTLSGFLSRVRSEISASQPK